MTGPVFGTLQAPLGWTSRKKRSIRIDSAHKTKSYSHGFCKSLPFFLPRRRPGALLGPLFDDPVWAGMVVFRADKCREGRSEGGEVNVDSMREFTAGAYIALTYVVGRRLSGLAVCRNARIE